MRDAPLGRFLAVPASLLGAVLVYAQVTGLPIPLYALVYAAYLFAPASVLLLGRARRSRWVPLCGLVAASLFWLPIEFALLPALPVPPPNGYDVSRGVGIVAAFHLFLVAWPLAGIGCTLALDGRDFRVAGVAWAAYATVALPLGLLTGFLTWHPAVDVVGLLATPMLIYTLTAVPEEFLFRGVIQNLLTRWWGPRIGLGGRSRRLWASAPPRSSLCAPRHAGRDRVWVGVCPDRQDYRVGPDAHRGELALGVVLVVPVSARMRTSRVSLARGRPPERALT